MRGPRSSNAGDGCCWRADPVLADHATAELVLAADQFVITPAGRVEDAARARAAGDEARTVIAGYHWFTDWGRDTMISLEGLTLTTGRVNEARDILRTFAFYFRDGLIPNLFPEGNKEGLYNTADATLWFFHALDRYLDVSGDWATVQLLLPKLDECDRASPRRHALQHRRRSGRRPAATGRRRARADLDGRQDGRLGRHAAARQGGRDQRALVQRAAPARRLARARRRRSRATSSRALRPRARDVVQPSDSGSRTVGTCTTSSTARTATIRRAGRIRSSSFSLRLSGARSRRAGSAVLDVVERRLLTPFGLRSLDPEHPDYQAEVRRRPADPRRRLPPRHGLGLADRAVHRCVDPGASRSAGGGAAFLTAFIAHLDEACVGTISEIFDAEPPYAPRGCVAQAWSVAEVLRCWVKTGRGAKPNAARRSWRRKAHDALAPGQGGSRHPHHDSAARGLLVFSCWRCRLPPSAGRSRTKRSFTSRASSAQRSESAASLPERKFFYIFTCEYCFSHWVTLAFLALTGFRLLYDDWRGYVIGGFTLVWLANHYMSLFGRLRLGIKSERIEVSLKEELRDKVSNGR